MKSFIANISKKININNQKKKPLALERYELKYTIPFYLIDPISNFISPYCVFDKFSEQAPDNYYWVNSLYFDTPHYLFLRQRLLKTDNRFNMRIRAYGHTPQLPYYFEIKQKRSDYIRKFRTKVYDEDIEKTLNTASSDLFCKTTHIYNANPVVLIQYKRKAFFSVCDDYARVTFDLGLRYMQSNKYDPRPIEENMIPYDTPSCFDSGCNVVLELKCYTQCVPLWMIDLIRTFGLNRRGFSKYANGVKNVFNQNKHRDIFTNISSLNQTCEI